MKIAQLWRYPVKSFAGESLTSVQVAKYGLEWDRRYALADGSQQHNGKPLTARHEPELLSFSAWAGPQAVIVQTPCGKKWPVTDPALAAQIQASLNKRITIVPAEEQSFHDAQHVLVVSAASLRALAREWDAPVNPLRFRPNIIIDGDDLEPYAETQWLGSTFIAGGATLESAELCERCVMTTIDPQTRVRSPDLLKLLAKSHAAIFGIYCRVGKPGTMSIGDTWTICR